ncbi:endonuclease 8-like 1 isoform X1 [Hemicordylus capensis]|uniref:endonuclease 8-like 1 isoform X1 n=1 Tax=Hemicordylus capensis TaxID=884348 RepID=UPI0023040863|nr:endonuclease 8-like 1 isoform X1 [Hemicordylus capensis]XP_053128828.1 endonuclease 8-like 1 isoform X1 [Hemicordylus capensis]
MPEGPELHLASKYINATCGGLIFSGQVEKSEVSKNPEVPFESDRYVVSATSRGKELKLTLTPVKREDASPGKGMQEPMDLVFRFGMSGSFKLVPVAEMPKHAHLRFYTKESSPRALCYVDFRRFGRWEVDGTWQADRGPCVMLEYEKFRQNVLTNLADKAFNKPICEALLNQKFFNGIGNYLRAEILHRLKIPPFEKARTVLENLQHREQPSDVTLSKKVKLKRENPDFLELCHILPMEVVNLAGGKGYDPEKKADNTAFEEWLQCYYVPGSKTLRDANGRTIWFQGDPGPMAPKGQKLHKKQLEVKADPDRPSPKVTKSKPRRNSKSDVPQEGAAKRAKKPRRKDKREAQESKEDIAVNGAGKPNTRARSKILASQMSPGTSSPARSQKRRASTRKNTGTAIPRSKPVTAE